jgi:hypothetical protein
VGIDRSLYETKDTFPAVVLQRNIEKSLNPPGNQTEEYMPAKTLPKAQGHQENSK